MKKPKVYAVTAVLSKELHDKIHRIAKSQDRSVNAVLRRFIVAIVEAEAESGKLPTEAA